MAQYAGNAYEVRSHYCSSQARLGGAFKRISNPGPLDPESHALPLRHIVWHISHWNSGKSVFDFSSTITRSTTGRIWKRWHRWRIWKPSIWNETPSTTIKKSPVASMWTTDGKSNYSYRGWNRSTRLWRNEQFGTVNSRLSATMGTSTSQMLAYKWESGGY